MFEPVLPGVVSVMPALFQTFLRKRQHLPSWLLPRRCAYVHDQTLINLIGYSDKGVSGEKVFQLIVNLNAILTPRDRIRAFCVFLAVCLRGDRNRGIGSIVWFISVLSEPNAIESSES